MVGKDNKITSHVNESSSTVDGSDDTTKNSSSSIIDIVSDDDIQQQKQELEAKTGKKYKIRAPRENINQLLVNGADMDAPQTLGETIQ